MRPPVLPAIAIGALSILLACATAPERVADVVHGLDPFASAEAVVLQARVRGPYLDTTLRTERHELRFLTPATESCAEVLVPESPVTYTKRVASEGSPAQRPSATRWASPRSPPGATAGRGIHGRRRFPAPGRATGRSTATIPGSCCGAASPWPAAWGSRAAGTWSRSCLRRRSAMRWWRAERPRSSSATPGASPSACWARPMRVPSWASRCPSTRCPTRPRPWAVPARDPEPGIARAAFPAVRSAYALRPP
jgi:hypothetical protein